MKTKTTYVCETCGFESENRPEVELCEAKHLGLDNLYDYHMYLYLSRVAADCTGAFLYKCNDRMVDEETKAYENLLNFEKLHNMKVR